MLQIQQQRALNAWNHAEGNAEKMRIVSPLDGLVVLRSVFRQGSMAEVREGEEVRAGVPLLDVVACASTSIRPTSTRCALARMP